MTILCSECGHRGDHLKWSLRRGELLCPECGCPEYGRRDQLQDLANEGDECAMADLFKEGNHGRN